MSSLMGIAAFGLIAALGVSKTPPIDCMDETLKNSPIDCVVEAPGIERWTLRPTGQPAFFRNFTSATGWSIQDLPFGRSVALLVGVSEYKYITPSLEGVENDMKLLRRYLLDQGGFDEVITLRGEAATEKSVQYFMTKRFKSELAIEDRLLFYFGGHSEAAGGSTGYFQFQNAEVDDLTHDVLPIYQINEWSDMLPARHVLFVLDTCVSDLAFARQRGDNEESLLVTLQGGTSRLVLTAGLGAQKTGEVIRREADGTETAEGVFTWAFLDALTKSSSKSARFLTTAQVYADVVRNVASLEDHFHLPTTNPQKREAGRMERNGNFVFLNKQEEASITPSIATALKVSQGHGEAPSSFLKTWRELSISLDGITKQGEGYAIDLGSITGKQPASLMLLVGNESGQERLLRIRVEGHGLNATFEGATWSTVSQPGKPVSLKVDINPGEFAQSDRIVFLGEVDEVASLRFHFLLADRTRTVEAQSGPKASGAMKAFSSAYSLCTGPAPAGYTLSNAEFWLTGDRACGSWSTCDWTQKNNQDVCFQFTLQGHDENVFDSNKGIRQSEGHLRAVYELETIKPNITEEAFVGGAQRVAVKPLQEPKALGEVKYLSADLEIASSVLNRDYKEFRSFAGRTYTHGLVIAPPNFAGSLTYRIPTGAKRFKATVTNYTDVCEGNPRGFRITVQTPVVSVPHDLSWNYGDPIMVDIPVDNIPLAYPQELTIVVDAMGDRTCAHSALGDPRFEPAISAVNPATLGTSNTPYGGAHVPR